MRPIIGAVALGALAVGGAIVLATSRHSGAVIGGVAGGAAGTVYDRKTRKKVYRQ